MKKKFSIFVICIFMLGVFAPESESSTAVTWTTAGNQILFEDAGFSVLASGSQGDPLIGGFIQLVYLGANGTYDCADPADWDTGDGILSTTDDSVLAYKHIGLGANKDTVEDGNFAVSGTPHSYGATGNFVIRFFEQPSINYASGLVPVTGDYGYVGGFTLTASPTDTFVIVGNQYADIPIVIPEPGTLLLGLLGMGVLAARRKRAK